MLPKPLKISVRPPAEAWREPSDPETRPDGDLGAFLELTQSLFRQQMADINGIDGKASRILALAVLIAVAPLAFVVSGSGESMTGSGASVETGAIALFVCGEAVALLTAVLAILAEKVQNWRMGINVSNAWDFARAWGASDPRFLWWASLQFSGSVATNRPKLDWKAGLVAWAACGLVAEAGLMVAALGWIVVS